MHHKITTLVLTFVIGILLGFQSITAEAAVGTCSFYTLDGRKTSSGETFSRWQYTAAHRTFPNGSIVRVTNIKTKKSVIVRINDYGPMDTSRSIDLSKSAFGQIASYKDGLVKVKIKLLKRGKVRGRKT